MGMSAGNHIALRPANTPWGDSHSSSCHHSPPSSGSPPALRGPSSSPLCFIARRTVLLALRYRSARVFEVCCGGCLACRSISRTLLVCCLCRPGMLPLCCFCRTLPLPWPCTGFTMPLPCLCSREFAFPNSLPKKGRCRGWTFARPRFFVLLRMSMLSKCLFLPLLRDFSSPSLYLSVSQGSSFGRLGTPTPSTAAWTRFATSLKPEHPSANRLALFQSDSSAAILSSSRFHLTSSTTVRPSASTVRIPLSARSLSRISAASFFLTLMCRYDLLPRRARGTARGSMTTDMEASSVAPAEGVSHELLVFHSSKGTARSLRRSRERRHQKTVPRSPTRTSHVHASQAAMSPKPDPPYLPTSARETFGAEGTKDASSRKVAMISPSAVQLHLTTALPPP
mmetsp:Transcript_38885/g.90657  ORF Transcript_38885/g.90657 Transcript_38885/m.90657 type:complete len:396 (-) Transcript_38885:54-1241(-)